MGCSTVTVSVESGWLHLSMGLASSMLAHVLLSCMDIVLLESSSAWLHTFI